MSTDSYKPSQEPESKRLKPNEPQFSRRHTERVPVPSSSFANNDKKTPSWLRTNQSEINGKYDKYGERPVSQSNANNDRVNRLKRARELQQPPDRHHQDDDDQEEEDEGISPYTHLQVANPSASHHEEEPRYQTFQSRISNREYRDTNSIVRAHYNQRTQQAKQQGSRVNSPIYKLRNFNNAIKYILLGNWVKHHPEETDLFALLDLCCGKGGDLNKCEFVGIDQYIGIDIADLSVKEAYERYSKQKARFKQSGRNANRYNFEACFATGDCFTQYVPDVLEPNFPGIINRAFPVDAVSAQFALHYSFESEEKVRTLLTNVTRSLCTGGTFIGTIPSSDFIKAQIVGKKYTRDDKGRVKFGNSLYSVTFEQDPPEDGVFSPAFGNKYNYWLKDAVDNVPEYVVPFETLRALCEEYDLVLKYKKNFIDIFNLEIPKYFSKLNRNLVEGMKRSDGKYGAEGDEKEAVGFYIGFVFEKV
ncbi:mRNA cap guanine-N7 methyltransferase [Candida viswanathii]|uniref:mRNA cap guanine-N(7) methyltransferase n=1 Tax=Candida viswanathii TaxID=5486 RepID=A0A367XV66_9ASCO|nr:mRNA cap guanine-N7 methyltransferase [Candida viswanathii]